MSIVLQGIVTGLVLSIYVGATFFTIVETSIRRGPAAAIILNVGVWVSDISFIILAYFGAAELMQPIVENVWVKILAGGMFMVFGLSYFFRKPAETTNSLSNNSKGVTVLFLKGFAINSLNPSVFIFWFGTMVMVVSTLKLTGIEIFYYFASVVGTVAIIDTVKVLSASEIRRVVNDLMMTRLFRITGIILISFGLFLIFRAFS